MGREGGVPCVGWERTEPLRVSVLVMIVDGGDEGGMGSAMASSPPAPPPPRSRMLRGRVGSHFGSVAASDLASASVSSRCCVSGWVAAKARHPCTMHDHSCAPHASTGAYTAALLGSVA